MLNCGMTQKDIADLQHSEVDWDAGRIIRKRSKTRKHGAVPEVNYKLWPETVRLLRQERSKGQKGPVLLNANGQPLLSEEVTAEGKYKKNDNIKSAFHRLQKKTKINKPLKSLKKTSATLIRGSDEFTSLESLFLGHAGGTIAHRHYAKAPQNLLDQAIDWLATEYWIE
jgi:integrase